MTDPKRLLSGEGSDFERELLGSLANERPPRALSRRMRQGLVALGLLTSAKTSIAGIAALIGIVSVGVSGGWLALQHQRESGRASVVSVAPRSAPPPVAGQLVPALPSAEPIEAPAPVAAPRTSAAVASAPSASGDLREQIAGLDRARAALRAGDSQAALGELTEYRHKFPRGEFAQEVTVLKIEALVQDGQMAGARSLGKKFIALHPESPHVDRIERLIGAQH
jgi:outer membrane lipoprotein YfiO